MRLYNVLLRFYPKSFRNEYGDEMRRIFVRRRREASGPVGVIALWLEVFLDTFSNAVGVHFDILRQDLRYTARTLAQSPGFTLTAIVVVALGVGANTAAFSITDHVLIRPLPFADADRLVKIWQFQPGYSRMEASPANFRDWRQMSKSFEVMGAVHGISGNMVGEGEPMRVEGNAVSPELFAALGKQPVIGRLFTAEDDHPASPATLLISYSMWQRMFGGQPDVLGRTVTLDDAPYIIIGVMPADFFFPTYEANIWRATRFQPRQFEDRNDNWMHVVAKLRRGVSLEQAKAEMTVIAGQLEKQYPKENEKIGINVIDWRDEVGTQARTMLYALCGAALCVLLIACTNLANLLLARALARSKELAVRTALGAGRDRLVRQLLTESLTLAVLGGAAGVALAAAALPMLTRLAPVGLPIAEVPRIDLRVLGFAGAVTLLTGTAFGVLPAWRILSGIDLSGLREGSRSGGGRKERLRSALVIAEVAVSVVLLVSGGLLLRALWKLQGVDPGFNSQGVLTLRTPLPIPKYAKVATRGDFYARVLSEVRSLPGVTHAAYISHLPMVMGGGIWPVGIGGQVQTRTDTNTASMRYVTPEFFRAMGIPLRQGRETTDADTFDRPWVAVVSESFVNRYWPRQAPIGRKFNFALDERTVVGVVDNIRVRGLERSSEPQVYLPFQQVRDGWIIGYLPKELVVRASSDLATLAPAIRQIVHRVDPAQPVSDVRTLSEIVRNNVAPRATQVRVIAAFAALAFLLAAIGIHGVLAFAVSQRSREIGVRIALGAQPRDILRMVMRQGFLLAAIGIIPGVALAYAAGRAMQSLLVGVAPSDAVTFAVAAALCVLMALAGSFLPALRAVRVDPITVMRAE